MRSTPALTLALAIALAAVAPLAGAAHTRSESAAYLGGTGDGIILCGINIGGACFTLLGDEVNATITIADDVNTVTSGYYQIEGPADELGNADVLANGAFCATTTVPVPAGAASLYVYVDEAFGLLNCGEIASSATTGIITVSYDLAAPHP